MDKIISDVYESEVYEPAEDSHFMKKNLKKYVAGDVLEIGTGSGILAEESLNYSNFVTAVDINPKSIDYCKKYIKDSRIEFICSDLFSDVPKKKFDTIICNPPYLPEDIGHDGKSLKDIALYGGKKGYEFIEKLVIGVESYLKDEGIILLLFSSFTNQKKVDEIIRLRVYDFELIDHVHISFEDLYIYIIRKSRHRLLIEKLGVSDIFYLNKGRRGIIYTGFYIVGGKNIKVAVKVHNPESEAMNSIMNESFWIKKLNKYDIGPSFLKSGDNYVIYEFVEGIHMIDFLKNATKQEIISCFLDVLRQCYILDILKVNKLELNHPHRNIIIKKNKKPVLIDFERCKRTLDPKNITQFCQYLCSNPIKKIYARLNHSVDTDKILLLIRGYKKSYDSKIIDKISEIIS